MATKSAPKGKKTSKTDTETKAKGTRASSPGVPRGSSAARGGRAQEAAKESGRTRKKAADSPAAATVDETPQAAPKGKLALSKGARRAWGVVIIFVALYLMAAMISYFFTWSGVNHAGKVGQAVADMLVRQCFGVFALCIPATMIVVGVMMLLLSDLHKSKPVRIGIITMILGSVSLGFMFGRQGEVFASGPGGDAGIAVADYLTGFFGDVGFSIILVMCWILLIGYALRRQLPGIAAAIRNSWNLSRSNRQQEREMRRAEKEAQVVSEKAPEVERPADYAADRGRRPAEEPVRTDYFAPAKHDLRPARREEVRDDEIEVVSADGYEYGGSEIVTDGGGMIIIERPRDDDDDLMYVTESRPDEAVEVSVGGAIGASMAASASAGVGDSVTAGGGSQDGGMPGGAVQESVSGAMVAPKQRKPRQGDDFFVVTPGGDKVPVSSLREKALQAAQEKEPEQALPEPEEEEDDSIIIIDTRPKEEMPESGAVANNVAADNAGTVMVDSALSEDGSLPDDGAVVEEASADGAEDGAGDGGADVLGTGGVMVTNAQNESEVLLKENKEAEADEEELSFRDPTRLLPNYQKPSWQILQDHSVGVEISPEEIKENQRVIRTKLEDFGIKITDRIKATIGPTVTLYEIEPAQGVKISKIRGLEEDIALALKVQSIRIQTLGQGRGTVGIEVPNSTREVVSMLSVIKSVKFQDCNYKLPIALGRTIYNEIYIGDLTKMPHLLVAGATGQGKSVGLNAIITSLLYKKHPAELKFVLVDPKQVELSVYAKLEHHFLAKMESEDNAIITDTQKAVNTLNSLVQVMEERYTLLNKAGERNLADYNEKLQRGGLKKRDGHKFLPYIVVIIDEFADMIMTAGREAEIPITRLAAKARAVGIHLIVATQRPDVKVITGLIKSNIPARIAFKTVSMVDSRTIIDQPGANNLIGMGDMLIYVNGELTRIQCAFVDTPEVERVTSFIAKQQGYLDAYNLPHYAPPDPRGDRGSVDKEDAGKFDAMFAEVARFVVGKDQGSTSAIQRNFELGYNRAGRLTDQLERAGIVGPANGSKPREVLVKDRATLEVILNDLGL